MKTQPTAAARKVSEPDSGHKATRILLIEDSRPDVVLVSCMLKDAVEEDSFNIIDVPRICDALDVLDNQSFDLILLDLKLLDIDGVAAVTTLRAESPHTPIIVYSGSGDQHLKQQALKCGAMHYLVKGRESAFSLKFMIDQALSRSKSEG